MAQSSVTNGRRVLRGLNYRTHAARRHRDLYRQFMQECGGQSEHLCKQAATCIVIREQMDADALNGKPIDQFNYVRIGNLLTRTLRALKQLSTKPAKSSNDATKHKSREQALLT